jgi:hypothetical protein
VDLFTLVVFATVLVVGGVVGAGMGASGARTQSIAIAVALFVLGFFFSRLLIFPLLIGLLIGYQARKLVN